MTNKDTFYYVSHPYEAYTQGYNVPIGHAYIKQEVYQAYTYFLPAEIISKYQALGDFYDVLINDSDVPFINRRRKDFVDTLDTAISLFAKIDHCVEHKIHFHMGSHENPLSHVYIGPVADHAITLNTYENVYEIISELSAPYDKPMRAYSIIGYHKQKYRDMLDAWVKPQDPKLSKFNINTIVAAAILFLYDTITKCGPETQEVFELFTNDFRSGSNTVNLSILAKAKIAAFFANRNDSTLTTVNDLIKNYNPSSSPSKHIPYSCGYSYTPPVPKFVKVNVIECYGELTDEVEVIPFLQTAEQIAFQEEVLKKQNQAELRALIRMYGGGAAAGSEEEYLGMWAREDWE